MDAFLHLLVNHDDDQSFQVIFSEFGGHCNHKCILLDRNYRNRSQNTTSNHFGDNNVNDIVLRQILDKIHFNYTHSYNIGSRLNETERERIHKLFAEKDENDPFINKQILEIHHIISNKQYEHVNTRTINKFCLNENQNMYQSSMYSFGFVFDYPYHGEDNTDNQDSDDNSKYDPVERYHASYCLESEDTFGTHQHTHWSKCYLGGVKYKYKNLKEELTQNDILCLHTMQFNQEWIKAKLHYISKYT